MMAGKCDCVEDFREWDASGRWMAWEDPRCSGEREGAVAGIWEFGGTVRYTWRGCGREHEILNPDPETGAAVLLEPVPGCEGLVLRQWTEEPDNVVLLDACGRERKRFRVPWERLGKGDPFGCTFTYIAREGPWQEPGTGRQARFGLVADVYWQEWEREEWYFELDWRNAELVWWCRADRGGCG